MSCPPADVPIFSAVVPGVPTHAFFSSIEPFLRVLV